MPLRFHLADGSAWAALRDRFADEAAGFSICDHEGADGPRLLLHRAAAGEDEVGFFLEDARSGIVEISAAASAPRELASAAWNLALAHGLTPIRLGAGQMPVLPRIRPLRGDSARLAVLLGQLLEERVIGSEDLDRLLQLRWPDQPHPFAALNALGPAERAAQLEQARIESQRAYLPAPLRRDLRAGRVLAERRVESRMEGDMARVKIVRPQALNALDPEMLEELHEAWDHACQRASVIVLESEGPAFMAGVDLDRILRWMEADRLDRIADFVASAHRLLERIDSCPAYTIARVDGYAVGAGAEFCCAFDSVVASEPTRIGFPELDLSIYPAMGGTQRLPRRIGVGRARAWILGAGVWSAGRARDFGMVDVVAGAGELDAAVLRLAQERPASTRAALVPRATDGPATSPPRGRPWIERPTVASRIASDLIELSRTASLAEGSRAELDHLADVYRTPEALTGLRFARRSRHR